MHVNRKWLSSLHKPRFAQTSNSQLRACFLCVAYSNESLSGSSSEYTALWKGLGENRHHCTHETCMNSQARQGFGVISCTGPIESVRQAFGPAVIVSLWRKKKIKIRPLLLYSFRPYKWDVPPRRDKASTSESHYCKTLAVFIQQRAFVQW